MAIPDGLTSYLWVAVCSVLLPLWLGFGCVRSLGMRREHGRRTTLAYAYLIGQLAMSLLTFAWLMLGGPGPGLLLPLAAAVAGAWLVKRTAHRDRTVRIPEHAAWWIWPPLLTTIVLFVELCSRVNLAAVRQGDESAIWAAKAKVLFAAPPQALHDGLHFFVTHADYPLFNPLVQALAYASADRILHWENRLPIQFFGVVLLVLMSAAMTRRSHPLVAGLVLVAFFGTAFVNTAPMATADIMLACATLAFVDALLRARETAEPVWWRLACCALAAMLASKNEGSMLALVVLAVFAGRYLLDRRRSPSADAAKTLRAARWLLLPAGVWLSNTLFKWVYGIKNDLLDPGAGGGRGLFERIADQFSDYAPQVVEFYVGYLLDPARSRWLPLLFIGACLVAIAMRRRRFLARPEALLLAVWALAATGYMLVFIGTNAASVQWHLGTAADRTMLHVLPIAAVGLCVAAWPRRAPLA